MSIFKGYKIKTKIELSQEKISQFPEIRGLLLAENPKIERKDLILSFRDFSSYGTITFDNHKRDIDLSKYHSHVSALYSGSTTYVIQENHFEDFIKILREHFNLRLINFERVFEPYWKVARREKHILVQWNPITNAGGNYKILRTEIDGVKKDIYDIPGLERYNKYYVIPISEGWRLFEIQSEKKSKLLEWESDELIKEVKETFDRRVRVKDIHTAEDSEADVEFADPDFKPRAHQRVAFEFLDLVDHKGIVAYGTGTGKTSIGIGDAIRTKSPRNIITCPGSLRLNWKRHIEHLTGEEAIILAGRIPTKYDFRFIIKEKPRWLIINYEILRTAVKIKNEETNKIEVHYPWADFINMYMPTYIMADESHYAKNPSASQSIALRQLESPRKIALSGTPIVNRPGELWSILNWLYPEQFPYYETFLNQYGWGRAIGNVEATKLRSLLETIMIKRMRKDISKNLPPVNRIVETFEMSARALKIYNRILDGIYKELAEFDHLGQGGEERRFKHILPKLNAMIKVCAADKVRITAERALEIADALEEDEWNKVLIFTKFKGTANTIARHLGSEALTFTRRTNTGFITAKMEERMQIVDEFQSNPQIKFLIATIDAAAEGLDITKAGVVMFNDLFWTPAKHIQGEGRAFYRESDMHGGDSYYLTFNDSIEEWIAELQGIKQNTIDKIVEGKGIEEEGITKQIIMKLHQAWKKSLGEG